MNAISLEIETFVLKGAGVSDPEIFASDHDKQLVSIVTCPDEAAHWWHWQKDKCFPGEGWVSVKLDGIQTMPMDAWTNVGIFWQEILDAAEGYVASGMGRGAFSEETATFSIVKRGKIAVFELRGNRYPVEPDSFFKALLGAAQDFFSWAGDYVGGFDRTSQERIKVLMGGFGH